MVELEVEAAVYGVKLEEAVARWESHFWHVGGIPSGDDDAARVGIVFEHVEGLGDLVDVAFLIKALVFAGFIVGFPFAPLIAVNGTEFAFFIGPSVPNWGVLG